MDVEVAHVLQIKTKDHGIGLVVPQDLILEHDGKKYLKLVGSHHWLCKLVCPAACKRSKNVSLANTSAMKELIHAVLAGFLTKEKEGEELFVQKPDEKKTLKRKRTILLATNAKSITLPDDSVAEFCLENHQSSCPAVLIENSSLDAVLGYLEVGCEDCSTATRAYERTGKFKKK